VAWDGFYRRIFGTNEGLERNHFMFSLNNGMIKEIMKSTHFHGLISKNDKYGGVEF
jgi:hypothetical protein